MIFAVVFFLVVYLAVKSFRIFVLKFVNLYCFCVFKVFMSLVVLIVLFFKRWKIKCFKFEDIKIFIDGLVVILNLRFLL